MSDPASVRAPATPAVAASLVLIRDGDAGIEVFCIERRPDGDTGGGVITFPGGRVEIDDLEKDWHDVSLPLPARASELAATPAQQRAVAIAACRHALDQAAVLPVNGSLTHSVTVGLRRTLAGSADAFRSALDARGLKIDLTSLVPFARWVTPVTEARRLDTRFFITRAPAGQDGLVGEDPETSRFWATPAAVLERSEQGQVTLDPPAHHTLSTLATLGNVDEALALAATMPLASRDFEV